MRGYHLGQVAIKKVNGLSSTWTKGSPVWHEAEVAAIITVTRTVNPNPIPQVAFMLAVQHPRIVQFIGAGEMSDPV